MDIAGLSMDMARVNLAQEVSISMMKMAMEQTEQVGAQVVNLLDNLMADVSSAIDVRV